MGEQADLGTHPVRDLPRPERVVQLCHPELRNEFPPLRTSKTVRSHNLPAQLTNFIGRQAEMAEVSQSVTKYTYATSHRDYGVTSRERETCCVQLERSDGGGAP